MNTTAPRLGLCLAALLAGGTASADPSRWYKAKRIDYVITGAFAGRKIIHASGDAFVKDSVQIRLSADINGTLLGPIAITNFKSVVSDVRAAPPGCFVPQLGGPFELYTLESVQTMSNTIVAATGAVRTDYPAMKVAAGCSSSRGIGARVLRTVEPFRITTIGEYLMDPAVLRGSAQVLDEASGTIVVNSGGGWIWTYKATPR